MIVSRRCCGEPSTGLSQKAEDTGADIDVVALAAVRATREAQVQRGREKLPSILGTPASGEMAVARPSMAKPRSRPFRAICRPIRSALQGRQRVSAPFQRQRRKQRFSLSSLSAAASREPGCGRSHVCLTSASTAPSSS